MFHSIVVSEPVALTTGVAMGIVGYVLAGLFGCNHDLQVSWAVLTSVLTNIGTGAPINAIALDALSLIIVRPASGYLMAKVVASLLT